MRCAREGASARGSAARWDGAGGTTTFRVEEDSAGATIVIGGIAPSTTTDRSNRLLTLPSSKAAAEKHHERKPSRQNRSWMTIVEKRAMPSLRHNSIHRLNARN